HDLDRRRVDRPVRTDPGLPATHLRTGARRWSAARRDHRRGRRRVRPPDALVLAVGGWSPGAVAGQGAGVPPHLLRRRHRPRLTLPQFVRSASLAWKACCSAVGVTVCSAITLVMSPSTLIWPDMNACIAADWSPS